MNAYLVVVLFTLPGPDAPVQELYRELASASSDAVCQAHADKLAAQQRAKYADALRKLRASVHGACIPMGSLT